jgi:homoprotocatechuate degradation regulator HpaR
MPDARKLNLRQFEQSLPMALMRAREAVMERFRPLLRQHRLTEQQWRVLRILAEAHTLTAREVAQRALVLSPSLSRILPKLEARGLIRRRSAVDDQRRAELSLTVAGRAAFVRVSREVEHEYRTIAAAFDPARLETLYAQLEDLRTTLVGARRSAEAAEVAQAARRRPTSRPRPPSAKR